jgi:predicted transcriptional regulator
MAKRAFGELETQILHILKGKERITVKEVLRILGNQDNYNTVMTVMNRLVEKKELGRERCGLQCQYWILEKTKSISLLDRFKEKLFGMKTSAMVSYLLESAEDLTEEDFAKMETMLQSARARKKDE